MKDWAKQREQLKSEIHSEIRDLKDRELITSLSNIVYIDARHYKAGNHYDVGVVEFDARFSSPPAVTFGQTISGLSDSSTTPLVVIPYVASWYSPSGLVAGFKLALYALTEDSNASKHQITWMARGVASRYRREQLEESWKSPHNDFPSYLNQAS